MGFPRGARRQAVRVVIGAIDGRNEGGGSPAMPNETVAT
jgi:hypothetical protein